MDGDAEVMLGGDAAQPNIDAQRIADACYLVAITAPQKWDWQM